MRFNHTAPIRLPKERIDLYRWLTGMTSADYQSFARAHRAAGGYFDDGVFVFVNIEMIGNELLVHHYRLLERRADHLRLYSKDSKAYVMRWFPATVGVPWELEIRSTGPSSCELSCTIGVDFPNAMVKIGGLVNGFGGLFVRRHLAEETVNFARDIERKFAA